MERFITAAHLWDRNNDRNNDASIESGRTKCFRLNGPSVLLKFLGKSPDWESNQLHHSNSYGWVYTHTGPDGQGYVPATRVWIRPALKQ